MAQTRFSQRLSKLMKERKISGQKIGDAIGKSQKTISRYATGEVDPSNEIKNQIYRVIADISGVQDDATTEEELALDEWVLKSACGDWTEEELQMGSEFSEENSEMSDAFTKQFENLSPEAKHFYVRHFRLFSELGESDMAMLDIFHRLTLQQQDKFMHFLENSNIDITVKHIGKKVGAFMQLMEISNERPTLLVDRAPDGELFPKSNHLKKELGSVVDEYIEKQRELGATPFLPWSFEFLSYTPNDWYFLMRLAIYTHHDKDVVTYFWNAGEYEFLAGSNLRTLLMAIEHDFF